MQRKYLWCIIAGIVTAGAAAWGPIVSNVEQAKYEMIESHGAIGIRDYAPMIVAEAEVKGDREVAINQGFRIIADYIFGNNLASQKVAMTAPVTQQGGDSGSWKVHFVMPSAYTMDNLPKPKNESVKLKEIPAKRYAVIRFSGMANNKRLEQKQASLEAFIAEKHLKPLAAATFAFFNPPWTLPFLRRNEVMIEISK